MAKVVWLFPGQGSQEVGMGKAVFEASSAARSVFEAADRALGRSISKLCFEGPKEDLMLTSNTQPALVTTSIALLAALRELFPDLPEPAYAAGHSLGEYAALVAAGALSLEDAVRLVELRGRAMQSAVPPDHGAMVAVMGDREATLSLCRKAADTSVLEPANFNAPGQVVLSGEAAAVQRAVALAPEFQLKGVLLKVSAPFHCSLMQPAARELDRALGGVALGPLKFPVFANVDAEPNQDSTRVRELLVRQVASPVLWEQTVSRMGEAGVTHALEIGPGKVLAGLVKRIDKRIQVLNVSTPDALREVPAFIG
jgi:[acyl-carrier-protein] S-malonyltransferase